MKSFLFIVIAAFTMGISACPSGIEIKIYSSQPKKGGFVRVQANEFVPYDQTQSWLGMTPDDGEAFINWCMTPDKTMIATPAVMRQWYERHYGLYGPIFSDMSQTIRFR